MMRAFVGNRLLKTARRGQLPLQLLVSSSLWGLASLRPYMVRKLGYPVAGSTHFLEVIPSRTQEVFYRRGIIRRQASLIRLSFLNSSLREQALLIDSDGMTKQALLGTTFVRKRGQLFRSTQERVPNCRCGSRQAPTRFLKDWLSLGLSMTASLKRVPRTLELL